MGTVLLDKSEPLCTFEGYIWKKENLIQSEYDSKSEYISCVRDVQIVQSDDHEVDNVIEMQSAEKEVEQLETQSEVENESEVESDNEPDNSESEDTVYYNVKEYEIEYEN